MDLQDFIPESDELIVKLINPKTGEVIKEEDGTEWYITLISPHTKDYRNVINEQANKRLQKAQKSKKMTLTVEEIEDADLTVLAKITKDWFIIKGGEKLELNISNAKSIYRDFGFVKQQVEEAIEDSQSFTN